MVEYALIFVGVALIVILMLGIAGVQVSDVYCQVVGVIGGKEKCSPIIEDANACESTFEDVAELENWEGN